MLVSKSLAFHFARGLTQTRTVAAFETTLRQSVKRPAAAMSTSTSDWQRHPPYCVEKKENDFQPTYEGSCHCEAVRFKVQTIRQIYSMDCGLLDLLLTYLAMQVRGEPLGVKYCHCKGGTPLLPVCRSCMLSHCRLLAEAQLLCTDWLCTDKTLPCRVPENTW